MLVILRAVGTITLWSDLLIILVSGKAIVSMMYFNIIVDIPPSPLITSLATFEFFILLCIILT